MFRSHDCSRDGITDCMGEGRIRDRDRERGGREQGEEREVRGEIESERGASTSMCFQRVLQQSQRPCQGSLRRWVDRDCANSRQTRRVPFV